MVAQTDIVITHSVGLHARPSVKFTKLAKTFDCTIEVSVNDTDKWIDAKSIVKVMGMKAPEGTKLHIRADGRAADKAVVALHDLVKRDFDEGHNALSDDKKTANANSV